MKVGTRSLLFGVHQVLIHPWFVAWGWTRLYGFPFDARLWAAFFVHDWGYWGQPNMDGLEGENHPILGAEIMRCVFDHPDYCKPEFHQVWPGNRLGRPAKWNSWYHFSLYHSRFFVRAHSRPGKPIFPSPLCYADKAAIVITPRWLFLLLAYLSGEIHEYRRVGRDPRGKYAKEGQTGRTAREWHAQMTGHVREWIARETGVRL